MLKYVMAILVIVSFSLIPTYAEDGHTLPVITVNSAILVYSELGTTFVDIGVIVSDGSSVFVNIMDSDMNLVSDFETMMNSVGEYYLFYNTIEDAAVFVDNTVILTVYVTDNTKPIITLVDEFTIEVVLGTTFVDPGAVVTDNDPNYDAEVTTTGTVDIDKLGEYTITYSAPDDVAGNITSEKHRLVKVVLVLSEDETKPKKSNGGCVDCIAPTLGLGTNYNRIVDNGFTYNGNSIQVEKWHTLYPLINATIGDTNTVEIIVYDNAGINNMKLVQFGLGAEEIGQPLSTLEVLIEVHLFATSMLGVGVEEIVIIDPDNLIDNDSIAVIAYAALCQSTDDEVNCIKVDLQYSYRESTINHIMVVNVIDKKGNSQNFYFNDGVQVLGESLNKPPTHIIQNRHTKQQTEDLTLTLTRTDKVNHIWEDKNGIEYLKLGESRFDRITPADSYTCNDPPLHEISIPTRSNCHFRILTSLWN